MTVQTEPLPHARYNKRLTLVFVLCLLLILTGVLMVFSATIPWGSAQYGFGNNSAWEMGRIQPSLRYESDYDFITSVVVFLMVGFWPLALGIIIAGLGAFALWTGRGSYYLVALGVIAVIIAIVEMFINPASNSDGMVGMRIGPGKVLFLLTAIMSLLLSALLAHFQRDHSPGETHLVEGDPDRRSDIIPDSLRLTLGSVLVILGVLAAGSTNLPWYSFLTPEDLQAGTLWNLSASKASLLAAFALLIAFGGILLFFRSRAGGILAASAAFLAIAAVALASKLPSIGEGETKLLGGIWVYIIIVSMALLFACVCLMPALREWRYSREFSP